MKISERQKQFLVYIRKFIKKNGYPPTTREIGGHFGISQKYAWDILKSLEEGGIIERTEWISRSIKIL